MSTRSRHYGWLVLLAVAFAHAQTTQVTSCPTESEHKKGPSGLEAWTLDYKVPLHEESYPETLVIARNGRVLRKIEGMPFIWGWKFFHDGAQVGYEAGPLHFGMTCILADLTTGKQLASYDCYHKLPPGAPSWVEELEIVH